MPSTLCPTPLRPHCISFATARLRYPTHPVSAGGVACTLVRMNDWPEGWTDDRGARYGRGSADAQPEGVRSMPHVRRPVPQQQARGYEDAPSYDSGYNTGQVYGSPQRAPHGGGGHGGYPGAPAPA